MQILIFLLILSVLVLIHELGHFAAARIFGINVEEFGIGLPPRARKLFSQGGTIFSLNWLPIGGFVRLKGEDVEEELAGNDVFYKKKLWQKMTVVLAGVVMNFLLGVAIFGAIYSYLGIPTKVDRVRITEIVPGSPADEAKIKPETYVFRFVGPSGAGVDVKDTKSLVELINENKGKKITLLVSGEKNPQEYQSVMLVARENPPAGQGALGVVLSDVELVKYPWWQMPFRGAKIGLSEAIAWGKEIAQGLGGLVVRILSGKGIGSDVAGPIGIYQVSGQVTKFGLLATLQFVAVLSINLAILNIMPFPALDGGRGVFMLLEGLLHKDVRRKVEAKINMVGMAALIGLMVLITMRDIYKLVVK